MIWKGDHYERIDCDDSRAFGEKSYDNVIALNKDILENFRRIEICDTTTFLLMTGLWYGISNKMANTNFFPMVVHIPLPGNH
ncbi:hypothetical protein H9W95_01735 [Flavobacterium lindanitolerans]|nr:hypothetical protein [Flavobacterium lindanitolerans]